MGAPSWSGAATAPAIAEQPLAAVALVGPDGTMERATALFLDFCGPADEFVASHESELDAVLAGDVEASTAILDGAAVDIAAAADSDGVRCALLTIDRPAGDEAGGGPPALLSEAMDASPAIAWLKDLDGRYLRVNRQYVQQLHVPAERVCGKRDDELGPGASIEGLRSRPRGERSREPLELEYTVDAVADRPAFAVLRFALRGDEGKPTALCGVAAPLGRADLARSECERFTRLERWGRSDEAAVRAELIAEWGLTPLSKTVAARPEPAGSEGRSPEGEADQFAALAAELDAAIETSARLDQELAEERRQVMAMREASVLAARRAQELLKTVTTERARNAELEESISRAEARTVELIRERDGERSRAERAEAGAGEAIAQAEQTAETLRAELAAAHEELERRQAAASEAPTFDQLEVERTQAHRAKLSAEEAQAELATTAGALSRERRAVEALRAELRAAEEEVGRVRRVAAEAVAQAPTQEELEHERRRADRANADLTSLRAHAEMAEAEAKSALSQARAEIRRMHDDAVAAADELTAHRQQVASLRGELTEARDALETARRAVAERLAERVPEVDDGLGQRAELAVQLEAERRTADHLRDELAAVRSELSAARAEHALAQDQPTAAAVPADQPHRETPPADETAPHWNARSQRNLSAALMAVPDWRTALKQVVNIVGSEGAWDAVVACCPDERRKFLKCVAMWAGEAMSSSTFETRVWQHRQKLPAERGGAQPPAAQAIVALETADDALLKAAGTEGMRSAVIVPIRDGTELIGTLQLLSSSAIAPSAELTMSLEGIGLQLASVAHLLSATSAPQWRVGRL